MTIKQPALCLRAMDWMIRKEQLRLDSDHGGRFVDGTGTGMEWNGQFPQLLQSTTSSGQFAISDRLWRKTVLDRQEISVISACGRNAMPSLRGDWKMPIGHPPTRISSSVVLISH
jgi:hypothetical protein